MEGIVNSSEYVMIAKYLGAAFVLSIGTLGVAMAQGNIGAHACESFAKANEKSQSAIQGAFFMAMVFVETSAIYCFILALILIYGK